MNLKSSSFYPLSTTQIICFFSQYDDAALSKDVSDALSSGSLWHNVCHLRNRCDPEYAKAEERFEPEFLICWERTLISKVSYKAVGRLASYSSYLKWKLSSCHFSPYGEHKEFYNLIKEHRVM